MTQLTGNGDSTGLGRKGKFSFDSTEFEITAGYIRLKGVVCLTVLFITKNRKLQHTTVVHVFLTIYKLAKC